MQIRPTVPQIRIDIISKQNVVTNKAVANANRAESGVLSAASTNKAQATDNYIKAQERVVSARRAQHNAEMQAIKQATAQLNDITVKNTDNANKIMAASIITGDKGYSTRIIGQFIDKFA